MYRKIIKTEWSNLLAERSLLLLVVAFAILVTYGTYNGVKWVRDRDAQSKTLIEAQEKDLAEKKEKTAQGFKGSFEPGNFQPDPSDPYSIGMGLQYAVLPFASTAVFSIGQSDVLPIDTGVTISTLQRTIADKSGFENPLTFLTGPFDLSFVIVYLLPLFVLAMSFNLLSSERESGTLQLLLATPVKLTTLLAAKVTAHMLLLFVFVIVTAVTGILLFDRSITYDFWLKFLLWLLLASAYAAFWFSMAVFINSFGLSTSANAVVSTAVWLILVLILPSLLNVAVSAVYPVPSRNEAIAAVRGVNLDMRKDGSRLLSEHYQDHPELLPKSEKPDLNDFGLAFVYVQREQKKRVDEVEDRFAEQLTKQQSLVKNLRFLSPSIITNEALNDIAGTGLERYTHFRKQVKEFDTAWTDFFVPKIFRLEKLGVADFDQIPRFRFQEEQFSSVFSRVIGGVLFLLVASAVLMLLAFGKLANYRLEK